MDGTQVKRGWRKGEVNENVVSSHEESTPGIGRSVSTVSQ